VTWSKAASPPTIASTEVIAIGTTLAIITTEQLRDFRAGTSDAARGNQQQAPRWAGGVGHGYNQGYGNNGGFSNV